MFSKDSGSEDELGISEERSSEFGSKDLTFREGDLVVGLVVGRSWFRGAELGSVPYGLRVT